MPYNQHIPQGNAFIINTPYIDRLNATMAADERQKKLEVQQQGQQLDNQFSRNIGAIRDADISEAADKWSKYKGLTLDMYKNGDKLNNNDRIAKDLERQRALGDYYSHINKSKAEKLDEEVSGKNVVADKTGQYNTDAANYISERRKIPVSKLDSTYRTSIDPATNQPVKKSFADISDNIKYPYGAFNFQPSIIKSEGGADKLNEVQEQLPDGKGTRKRTYIGLKPMSTFVPNMVGELTGSEKPQAFIHNHDYTTEHEADVLSRFNAYKNTPLYKAAYPNEPDVDPKLLQNPLTRAITLMGMERQMSHPPLENVGKVENNKDYYTDKANAFTEAMKKEGFAHQEKMEGIKNNDIIARAKGNPSGQNFNNLYKNIDDRVNEELSKGYNITRLNSLGSDAQDVILKSARLATKNEYLTNADIFISKVDGKNKIFSAVDNPKLERNAKTEIGTIPEISTNLKSNTTAKSKGAAIDAGQHKDESKTNKPVTNKWDKYRKN